MRVCLLFACLLMSQWAFGAHVSPGLNHTISGTVVDQTNGAALTGVRIMVAGSDQVVYSDESGHFEVVCDVSKPVSLAFDLVSFQSVVLPISFESAALKVGLVELP